MSQNFFKINKGVNLTPQTSEPSGENGDIYYNSSFGKFRQYQNGSWKNLGSGSGSGSGKNYLSDVVTSQSSTPNTGNGDFELGSTAGWSLGTTGTLTNAFPTGTPTFGSGASGNLSITVVNSSQLAGSYSLSYDSSAATTAGDMLASDAFYIDTEDQAKVLTFKFAYQAVTSPANADWSGTSSNSFGVAIYDVTNSAWIQPAGVFGMTQSSGVGICTGTFQTSSNGTQYRLVVYNANATAGAITVYFDDFSVSPQTAPIGFAGTDPEAFAPSGSWITNSTYTGWKTRTGKFLRVEFQINLSGAPTATGLTINLPSGLVIDTAVLGSGQQTVFGQWGAINSGTNYRGTISLGGVTSVSLFYQSSTAAAHTQVNATTPVTWTNGDSIAGWFEVPIVGWSSNVQMSNDTDTRVINATLTSTGVSIPSNSDTPITTISAAEDSVGAWNGGTQRYTIPVTGVYDINGRFSFSADAGAGAATQILRMYKNGVLYADIAVSEHNASETTARTLYTSGSFQRKFNAGDYLTFYLYQNAGVNRIGIIQGINIKRLSGPSVIAATESVNMRYYASTTSISGTLSKVTYSTKDYDSHNSYSSGTFTAPVSGKYRVSASVSVQGSTNNAGGGDTLQMYIYKNATTYSGQLQRYGVANEIINNRTIQIVDSVNCNAGDTIDIRVASDGTGQAITTNNFLNFLCIERVGN